MFDTMEIAKRIKRARIEKNMTQLQLADVMGVSYQAVSNWERGNSMPDISKLGDLCNVLALTVNELLGMEEKTAAAVTKAMDKEKLTVEELKEVAPMLPPEQMTELIRKLESQGQEMKDTHRRIIFGNGGAKLCLVRKPTREDQAQPGQHGQKMDISAIMDLAPFLDEEYLSDLVEEAEPENLSQLACLAPFLSRNSLRKMVSRCESANDFGTIMSLAPFLDRETLDDLVDGMMVEDIWQAISLAPFLRRESLDKLVMRCEADADMDALSSLAPFLSKETLRALADRIRGSEI